MVDLSSSKRFVSIRIRLTVQFLQRLGDICLRRGGGRSIPFAMPFHGRPTLEAKASAHPLWASHPKGGGCDGGGWVRGSEERAGWWR